MSKIPRQLQNDNYRFIKVGRYSKEPTEKWTTNNYGHDDNELQNWIEQGNNYGIINKSGNLLVIDADNEIIAKDVVKHLPKTFSVQTSTPEKFHIYYQCDDMTEGKIIFRDGLGDIRKNGNYFTVCPDSTHPNGETYKVKIDAPITKITEKEVLNVLGKYARRRKKIKLGH